MSWMKNQLVPEFCEAGWAEASTSSLADRFNIMNGKSKYLVNLNTQTVINCKTGGSCKGGTPTGMYYFAHTHGVPDNTCQQYTGKDSEETCTDFDVCRDCKSRPPTEDETGLDGCWSIDNYQRYYAKEFGLVQGSSAMKKEIFKRGPISCGMHVTKKFTNHQKGGIYKEDFYIYLNRIKSSVSVTLAHRSSTLRYEG